MQLPLQGALSLSICLPRALPWASSSCPFGARNTINIYAKRHIYIIMGVAFACLKVAARTLQLLFLPCTLPLKASEARGNREQGAL